MGDPQMSPDGHHVLFSRKTITEKNAYQTHVYSVDRSYFVKRWTSGEKSCSHGRWSPDGNQIAFMSGRDEPASQIFLMSTHGGEAVAVSKLPEGSIGGFEWSPDGKKIAFTFRETSEHLTKAANEARKAKGGSEPPIEIDSVWYRLDGDGYFANQRYKVFVLDVASGVHSLVCDSAVDGNYSFSWSPSSDELAIAHTISKRPFADEPNIQIWRVGLDGAAVKLEGLPKGTKSAVRWSPDGKWIAYAGDVHVDDPWGTRNTKIYVVSSDGGEPKCLSDHTDYCMGTATLSDAKEAGAEEVLHWAPRSDALYVQVGWHGESQLGRFTLEGEFAMLTEGRHFIGVGSLCANGRHVGIIYGHPLQLPEVGVLHLGSGDDQDRDILTDFNRAFHNEVKLSEPEEIWLDSTDGVRVHGWVIKPIDYLAPKRYSAVLEIHGGPHAQYGWTFFHEFQVLAAEGHVVVYTNPRGSKGYGESFCSAIRGDWGNKDWDDIQTATRWMQQQSYIHPGQMGVMGGSYGGYMTNWVIGHTHDYKAAITDRCVSNMVSMAMNSDFPFNKDGYFKGIAWGSHESIKELWRQSPIAYFENVKTPTLVIHSEGDLRCNIEQSEEVFAALQQEGIESRFVRYPKSTSHGMSRNGPPDLRLHRLNEIVMWWKKFLH